MQGRDWLAAVLAAAAFQALVPVLPVPLGYAVSDVLVAAGTGYAAIGFWRRARVDRSGRRALLAGCAATGLWAAANLLYLPTVVTPSVLSTVAMTCAVAAAMVLPVGLMLWMPVVSGLELVKRCIDIAATGGAVFALIWLFVLAPAIEVRGAGRPALLATVLSLPELLAATLALIAMSRPVAPDHRRSLRFLGIASITLALTALTAMHNTISGAPWHASGVGGGYVLAALLFAVSSRRTADGQPVAVDRPLHGGWVTLPYMPILLAIAATAFVLIKQGTLGPVVAGLLLSVFTLVLVRQFLSLLTLGRLNRQLQQQRVALAFQARHDPLTGLLNRAALAEEYASHLQAGTGALAMVIDLDRFKPVNDTLGHAAGDQVLRTIADRLRASLHPSDVIGRLGGDEFVVVLPGRNSSEGHRVAELLTRALVAPIEVDDTAVVVGCSIGLAVAPVGAAPHLETLLREADAAMYAAKAAGRGVVRWLDPTGTSPGDPSTNQRGSESVPENLRRPILHDGVRS